MAIVNFASSRFCAQDNSGAPLSSGLLNTYETGTTIPVATYADESRTIPNSNPVVLNARGEAVIYVEPTQIYTFLLMDSVGSPIWTQDGVCGVASYADFDAYRVGLASAAGASEVGYQQAMSGTTRTVQDRLRDSVDVKDFGAAWDALTDDTIANQQAFDFARLQGKVLTLPTGRSVTGPLTLNDPANRPPNEGWPAVLGLKGEGRISTVFAAKSGAYEDEYVLAYNNTSGITMANIGVDGQGNAQNGMDLSWRGGSSGVPNLAPSNNNILENIFVDGCARVGINLNQFHDSKISGIWVRGVDADGVALSIEGSGGQLAIENVWIASGVFRIGCQNAGIQNAGFFQGAELTGGGYNNISLTNVHFFPNLVTEVNLNSTAGGNATRGIFVSGSYFNTAKYHIAGRFWNGGKLVATQFGVCDDIFGEISAAAGGGDPPVFVFEHCTFVGKSPLDSTSSDVRWIMRHCTFSTGQSLNYISNFDERSSRHGSMHFVDALENGFQFGEATLTSATNYPILRSIVLKDVPYNEWVPLEGLAKNHNGAMLVQIATTRGGPHGSFALAKPDFNSVATSASTLSACTSIDGSTTIDIRWENVLVTGTIHPEIMIVKTGGAGVAYAHMQATTLGSFGEG